MQTESNACNRAVRARAGLLIAASAAALLVPALWQPATGSPTPGDPTGLVVVVAGWAAWALTIYLALGTGIAAVGHLGGATRPIAGLAPRAVRRFVEIAVGASSVAVVCLAPAVAYADAPPSGPVASASPLDWPGLAPAAAAPVHDPAATPAKPRPPRQPHPHPHHATALVVRPGDSLWSLTARQLGPRATAARIAAAWPRLYEANRRAIGANPNLIHPGQQLLPPAPEERTSR